ncbi:hypothetical protein EYF80_066868 [Liparis tanakae]|uniref:Uncharacterized protein n=1 Tax=Liparis tanakae TaxID=230148 RepID=A0A4Z2E2K4_9TELE|nr:hypothetical protein EYF80_066868 [Liparis tanakae]
MNRRMEDRKDEREDELTASSCDQKASCVADQSLPASDFEKNDGCKTFRLRAASRRAAVPLIASAPRV